MVAGRDLSKEDSRVALELIGVPNWEECEALAKSTVNSFDWSHSSAGTDCKQNLCAISNNQPQSPEFTISTKFLMNHLQETQMKIQH